MDLRTIDCERHELRPLEAKHAPALLAYYTRNADYLQVWEPLRSGRFYTLEQQHSLIEKSVADARAGLGARFLAFEPAGTDVIATFGLSNIRRGVNHAAIVSYSVDREHAGRGYATELLAGVVRYAFDNLRLHRLDASYQPENRASGKVLRKNGFIVEGYARDYLFLNGAWRDSVLVSRTNDAWSAPP